MKYLITLLIIITSFTAYSQNDINKITAKTKMVTLPLGSYSERMRKWTNNNPSELDSNDRQYLINALKNNIQLVVNPKGGTSFGDLDYRDPWSFLDEVKRTALVGIIKISNLHGFIVYLKDKLDEPEPFAEWHGILISCNDQGQIVNWIYSDGDATGGNPHGNISREFTIFPSGIIKIEEGAWGDNTDTYGFRGTLKIINNKIVLQHKSFLEGKNTNNSKP